MGISDEDTVGLGDWAIEVQRVEGWKSGPLKGIDLDEGWEGEGGQDGESGQSHGSSDGGKGLSLKSDEIGGALSDEVSVNLANAVQVDNTAGLLIDDNVSGELLAGRGDGGGIRLGLDDSLLLGADLVGALGCGRQES